MEALKRLLMPWASQEFEAFPVGSLVNSARNDVEACRREQAPEQMMLPWKEPEFFVIDTAPG